MLDGRRFGNQGVETEPPARNKLAGAEGELRVKHHGARRRRFDLPSFQSIIEESYQSRASGQKTSCHVIVLIADWNSLTLLNRLVETTANTPRSEDSEEQLSDFVEDWSSGYRNFSLVSEVVAIPAALLHAR
eukprot:759954-Hanusia_phi.AAC.2